MKAQASEFLEAMDTIRRLTLGLEQLRESAVLVPEFTALQEGVHTLSLRVEEHVEATEGDLAALHAAALAEGEARSNECARLSTGLEMESSRVAHALGGVDELRISMGFKAELAQV